ncbi:hypothetical protein HWV62_18546 [Athelia sp. TMB]|nr:hypothetical protein HWV62_18546 [Athelia sp. TMB]
MGSSSIRALWSHEDVLTSPDWRVCFPVEIQVLSCHIPRPKDYAKTWSGGLIFSAAQQSPDPSQVPSPCETWVPSPMQARASGLASLFKAGGALGDSSLDGNFSMATRTSAGRKQSALSSSPDPSPNFPMQMTTSSFTATTRESSTAGGTDVAGTGQLTLCSAGYMMSSRALTGAQSYMSPTFLVPTTPLTAPHVAYTLPTACSSLQSNSQLASNGLLWMQRSHTQTPNSSTSNVGSIQPPLLKPSGGTSQIPATAITTRPNSLINTGSRFSTNLATPANKTARPKVYQPGLTPTCSALRPHCLTRDCLQKWLPLAKHQSAAPDIPEADFERILAVLVASYATGTCETYGAGLLIYHVFCDQRTIHEAKRCPADTPLMLAFVASLAGAYLGKTLATYIFAVRAWHTIHGQPWAMNDIELKAVITGAANLAPPSSKRAKHAPWTVDLLLRIFATLDDDNPLHIVVKSAAAVIFFSAARTGEFLQKSLASFNPKLHVKPSDLCKKTDREGHSVTSAHLPVTKVARDGEDVAWGPQHQLEIDPDTLLAQHYRVNQPHANGPLFAWKHAGGTRALTKTEFMKCINNAAASLSLETLQGHGLGIGATLEYLLRGVSFETVKAIGRWSSDAFVLYLRQHAVILAPYLQGTPIFAEFNRIVMPPPR